MTVYVTICVCVAVVRREKEEREVSCVSCFSSSSL